ncbi:MAG: endonuclease/exonuclease/phosphatase family protein [Spirochaetes bacterium]|nr:endonuclease/exonuclease/phosphatase family protein [Spirochaetota bacterium]
MKNSARPRLRGLLAVLPAFLIIGVVGSLFVFNVKGTANSRVSTIAASPAKSSSADKPKVSGLSGGSAPFLAPRTDTSSRPFRILSWNLRDCAATDSKTGERLSFHEPIAEVLSELKPDLAAFVEIQQDDEKGGDIALLQVALAKAGWAMPYQTSVETGGQDDIAVFSRSPILSSESVLEPGSSESWPRPGLHAVVEAAGEKLDFFIFHFKAMSDKDSEAIRKAQAKAEANLVRKDIAQGTLSGLVVVAGDLNTTNPGDRGSPDSTLGLLMLKDDSDPSNDFKDPIEDLSPQVPTFVDKHYRSVLDHLILSPKAAAALEPGSALVYTDLPAAKPIPISDHRPILVELNLNSGK